MSTNKYFNNYGSIQEQRLVEDLIVESIKIMGTDIYYLPNDNDQARDLLYGEDPLKKFSSAYPIEIYPINIMDYGGEKEFFSKFGLEIKNQITVLMSKRSFSQRVPQNTFTRPREGDLIYVPFLNGTGELYEIKFTNKNKDFFMLGRRVPYFYELEMEKFKYSQEVIDTGIPDIDDVVTNNAYTINLDIDAITGTGEYNIQELVYQSLDNTYANATTIATVQAWLPLANTLSVSNISGEFVDDQIIIGLSSNAHYNLISFDPLNVTVKNEVYDNQLIGDESVPIIDNSTSNPFGSL
jgi:hypothetical protein